MAGTILGDNTYITGSLVISGSLVVNEDGDGSAGTGNTQIKSANRDYAIHVDAANDRIGLGCFIAPTHHVEIQHEGGDGDQGLMIVRYDGAVYTNNLLGGVGFDNADPVAGIPSQILEASSYVAGYAAENHSITNKGGYLVFGTANIGDDMNTATPERMRISSAGNVGIGTTAPQNPLDLYEMGGLVLGISILNNSGGSSAASYAVTTSMAVPTNRWKVTFTAPASGKVEIQFQGYCHSDTSSGFDFLYLGLSDSDTYNSLGNQYEKKVRVPSTDGAGSSHDIITHSWYLTGLTAGTSYTYYVGTTGRNANHTWKWGGTDQAEYPDLFIRALSLPNTVAQD